MLSFGVNKDVYTNETIHDFEIANLPKRTPTAYTYQREGRKQSAYIYSSLVPSLSLIHT